MIERILEQQRVLLLLQADFKELVLPNFGKIQEIIEVNYDIKIVKECIEGPFNVRKVY